MWSVSTTSDYSSNHSIQKLNSACRHANHCDVIIQSTFQIERAPSRVDLGKFKIASSCDTLSLHLARARCNESVSPEDAILNFPSLPIEGALFCACVAVLRINKKAYRMLLQELKCCNLFVQPITLMIEYSATWDSANTRKYKNEIASGQRNEKK